MRPLRLLNKVKKIENNLKILLNAKMLVTPNFDMNIRLENDDHYILDRSGEFVFTS